MPRNPKGYDLRREIAECTLNTIDGLFAGAPLKERDPQEEYEYTVVPVIAVDYRYHTDEQPECFAPDCDCHVQSIADAHQALQAGLVSESEAVRMAQGRMV